jgi:hypothetical protein
MEKLFVILSGMKHADKWSAKTGRVCVRAGQRGLGRIKSDDT